MRHIRMLGLCLVAALAVCAYAVSSASALPEFGKCEAKAGGNYKDANCTEKAKKHQGAYEWIKGAKLKSVHFAGENVGSGGVLTSKIRQCEGSNGGALGRLTRAKCEGTGEETEYATVKIECEHETSTGNITGSKSITDINVRFKGCKAFGAVPCSNGPEEGEIDVNPLKGTLGYISKSEHTVGVLLEPVAKHGEFAKFNCAGKLTFVVGVGNSKEGAYYEPESHGGYDGIISPITPVNTMTSEYTQVYSVNSETAENIPNKFEGKHIDLLETYFYPTEDPEESSMWSRAGEEITNVNDAVEEGEIKA